jgi:hypothetical protein
MEACRRTQRRASASTQMRSRPDRRLQRLIGRVLRAEHMFERADADAVGDFGEQPVGAFGDLVHRCVKNDETMRLGRLAERGLRLSGELTAKPDSAT